MHIDLKTGKQSVIKMNEKGEQFIINEKGE